MTCPMCREELRYDDGTHDLRCSKNLCVFGISFSKSGEGRGILWDFRIIGEQTDYTALMMLMQEIELRNKNGRPMAPNVPNLPKKVEKTLADKLAFRYGLEIEDLYSIKHSTETLERLATIYKLNKRDVRHIKQADVTV